jgi:putative ATPase
MILWGPPGCGKTTLALLLARYADAEFKAISAVLSGLPDVRAALAEAEATFAQGPTHGVVRRRSAPLQQVPAGRVPAAHRARRHHLVGATTENPSFELNSALALALSRACTGGADHRDIVEALRHALDDTSAVLATCSSKSIHNRCN